MYVSSPAISRDPPHCSLFGRLPRSTVTSPPSPGGSSSNEAPAGLAAARPTRVFKVALCARVSPARGREPAALLTVRQVTPAQQSPRCPPRGAASPDASAPASPRAFTSVRILAGGRESCVVCAARNIGARDGTISAVRALLICVTVALSRATALIPAAT